VIKKRARQARQKRGILILPRLPRMGKKSQNALDSAAKLGVRCLHRPQLPRLPRFVMRTGSRGWFWSKGDFSESPFLLREKYKH